MQNIEFKAELRDLDLARARCQSLEATFVRIGEQKDTYYRLLDGRLKRRESPGDAVEWIFYHRTDRPAARICHYMLYSDEQARARWGVLPLREWIVVQKVRELWLLGNVRIHLDQVTELGTYIEFEAQVSRRHDVKTCHGQIASLRESFGPILGEAIAGSYADLLERLRHEPADE